MKTIIIIIALAVSMTAMTQDNPASFVFRTSSMNTEKNVHLGLLDQINQLKEFKDQQQFEERVSNLTFSYTDLVPIADSIYYWEWDSAKAFWVEAYRIVDIMYGSDNFINSYTNQIWTGNSWENEYQYLLTYDGNNNMTNEVERSWNGSFWENEYQTIYSYDSANRLLSLTYQEWDDADWENSSRFTYAYDASNNRISELYQDWNGSMWVNVFQLTTLYDSNNKKTSELSQQWNGNAWENSAQNIYTYSDNNLQTLQSEYWDGSAWIAFGLIQYDYDANSNKSSEIFQFWNGFSWNNINQSIYMYDANNNLASQVISEWNGIDWVATDQFLYDYDANGNLIQTLQEAWDGNEWVRAVVLSTEFDENDFIVKEVNKYYNSTGDAIAEGDSTHYYFHTIVGLEDVTEDVVFTVYPNPSGSELTVELQTSHSNPVTFKCHDLSGRLVFEKDFYGNKHTFDLSPLLDGMYFLGLYSEGQLLGNKSIVKGR